MPEVKTPPIYAGDLVCFTKGHALADIVRWIMVNRSEAEEVHRMLGDELDTQHQVAIPPGVAPQTGRNAIRGQDSD